MNTASERIGYELDKRASLDRQELPRTNPAHAPSYANGCKVEPPQKRDNDNFALSCADYNLGSLEHLILKWYGDRNSSTYKTNHEYLEPVLLEIQRQRRNVQAAKQVQSEKPPF